MGKHKQHFALKKSTAQYQILQQSKQWQVEGKWLQQITALLYKITPGMQQHRLLRYI